MEDFKNGTKVMVNSDNDNECYDSFRNKVLIITGGTNDVNIKGYDSSMYPQFLYFLKEDNTGKNIPCSLYYYELEAV